MLSGEGHVKEVKHRILNQPERLGSNPDSATSNECLFCMFPSHCSFFIVYLLKVINEIICVNFTM